MKTLPIIVGALLSVAALAVTPALAQTPSITVNHPTMTMTVGQTADVYVSSEGSWPGIAGGTCGSLPPGKPSDMVAITSFQQTKGHARGNLTLYLKAQHPGHCFIRYSVSATVNGKSHTATAQTDFTVKP